MNTLRTPWGEKTIRQKAASIGIIVGLFFGCALIAYAVSSYFTSQSFSVNNPKKHIFTIDLTGQVEATALGPGDSQSIAPKIENTGTEKMYVFIRINCSDDGIYSFTPSGNWTAVETSAAGEMVYAYGEPTAIKPDESATLSGTMTVVASNAEYSELADDALYYTVTGCAIGTDAESSGAAALYNEYLSSGGE